VLQLFYSRAHRRYKSRRGSKIGRFSEPVIQRYRRLLRGRRFTAAQWRIYAQVDSSERHPRLLVV